MFVIAGPCVIESERHALGVAETLARIAHDLDITLVYKSSFDKANRTSGKSPRGPGQEEGLRILAKVRAETGLPVLTDIHEAHQAASVAQAVDVLQIPAFLCRQTDLLVAAIATGKPVNLKKGQFMAPGDMAHAVAKAQAVLPPGIAAGDRLMLCERGTSFGYHDLVVDMRGLEEMRDLGCNVVFDASHSVQQPGKAGDSSGGQRMRIPVLARAAVAAGIDGLFIETHPEPEQAMSDSATVWPLDRLAALLGDLLAIERAVRERGMVDPCRAQPLVGLSRMPLAGLSRTPPASR